MKGLLFALCVVFGFDGLNAQTTVWQPSPGHTQVPIWPGRVPDPQPVAGPEFGVTAAKERQATPAPKHEFCESHLYLHNCGTRSQPCSTLYASMAGQAKVSMPGLIRRGCSGQSRLWQLVLQIVTVFPVCDGDRECSRDTLQFPRA